MKMESPLRQMRLFRKRKTRKEDLKKLSIGGRTDFNPVRREVKTLIVLLLLSCDTFAQVPINGFCKYQVFDINPGYLKFEPLNYNNDSYTDLLFYNPAGDNSISLDGNQNGTFGSVHVNKLQQPVSDIQYLWNKNSNIYAYAYISRRESSAGILNFSSEGTPGIESQVKFNTYPENLSTGDINGDGIPELLVSGSAFNGLSLVYQEKKLREKKIIEKTSYSEAVFADLNNDGYPDIAAFEIFSNRLQFFYNNSQGNFNRVREISFSSPISSLQSTDLDLDSYTDLLYSNRNSIGICYGDFTSSYDDTVIINTRYGIDKIITGDFNRDGRIDIAYINKTDGTLSLIYARDDRKFYPELVYLKKNRLDDIIPYYSKFINGIALLDSNGKLYIISNLASISDEVSIVSGAYPTAVAYFDRDNNSINDLCFIDGYNKTLNLLTRSSSGIPDSWFSFSLFGTENSILVNNKLPQEKTFICYTRDKKLIEIVNVDFVKNKYSRSSLYSPGRIRDIKVKENSGRIYAAFIKDDELGAVMFSNKQGQYSDYTIPGIRKGVSDAALSVYNNPEVFYTTSDDSIIIGERILEENRKNAEVKTQIANDYNISLFAGDFLHQNNSALFGFLSSRDKNNLVFFLGPEAFIVSGKNTPIPGLRIKDKNQLFFGELRFNGPAKVCYFNPLQKSVKTLETADGNKKIVRNLLIDNINSRSFFIKNMNSRSYHIVYIDDNENCINIRELK